MTDTIAAKPITAAAQDRDAGDRAFIDDVRKLDKGQLAILRRNAGNSLAEARGISWFYWLLNKHAGQYHEEVYFLVATLLASDKSALAGNTPAMGNIGATMARVYNDNGKTVSTERRFQILLDAQFDPDGGGEMAYRLRQTVKLALSKRGAVNWPQLLADLRRWDSPYKTVQKQWARSFYDPFNTTAPDPTETAPSESESPTN